MSNQRSAPRHRTYLKAEIDLNGLSKLSCVIHDLNDAGARLSLSDGIVLPDSFGLHLPKSDRWVSAQVRWRRGDRVGVEFEAEAVQALLCNDDGTVRMRQLEAEIVRLRRMLEELRNDPAKINEILDRAA